MTYFRIHTADLAYVTKRPRGIFTAVSKLAAAKALTAEETAEYWKNREHFERVLPVPPIYADGNARGATTWFKEGSASGGIISQMGFYFSMAEKYGLELFKTTCSELPGELLYEDDFQVAVVENDTAVRSTAAVSFGSLQ